MIRQHRIRPESGGDQEAVRTELAGIDPWWHDGVDAALDEPEMSTAKVVLDEGLGR
jgi:hypothetical protein